MKSFSFAGLKDNLGLSGDKKGNVDMRRATVIVSDSKGKGKTIVPGSKVTGVTFGSINGRDCFDMQKCVSELLSPACGMTEEEKAEFMRKIMAKLASGSKLTQEELEFLQAENPQLYQQVVRVQNMRNSFEEQLKHARSKEEAQRLYADFMSGVGDDDPMREYLVAAYQNVMDEFQSSEEYQKLPAEEQTEQEREQGYMGREQEQTEWEQEER